MEYRIDYDRVDVADIMNQVKKRVADGPPAPGVPVAGPAVPPPARGWKRLLKKTAWFLVRPYLPFLLPVAEWLKFRLNYDVNVRIDGTATRLEKVREEILARMGTLWQEAVDRSDGTTTLLGKTLEKVSAGADETADRLWTTRDTVKLLHNLGHNLVLELTKLKVEEEALKSKVRVLEKELETLGRREKAIEKRVFE